MISIKRNFNVKVEAAAKREPMPIHAAFERNRTASVSGDQMS